MERAACRGSDVDFYPEHHMDAVPALLVCARCPVVDQCRTAAALRPERFGVWGGQSEEMRGLINGGVSHRAPARAAAQRAALAAALEMAG